MRWVVTGLVLIGLLGMPVSGLAQGGPQPRSAYELIQGLDVPETPAVLNRVAFVRHWFGPPRPEPATRAVLILIPGIFGGAEDYRYVGTRLVTRLPWLQVWAVDRRNNLLENRCGLEAARNAGNPLLAVAYYFGGQDLPGCPPHLDPDDAVWNGVAAEFAVSQQEAAAVGMAQWGLATEIEDVRRLVAYARQQYPRARVFLGGHSLGGMTAQLYAAWRFGAGPDTAGWRSIDGIVLIDGGVWGTIWNPGLILQSLFERNLVATGTVYWDDVARGATPLLGIFAGIAGMAATQSPAQESILWPMLPGAFAWPNDVTCPTNKALVGAFSDDDTGTDATFLMHQGTLSGPIGACAPPNEGRALLHWVDFDQTSPPELSSTDIWARALWMSGETNAVEWYFSIMVNADIDLAFNLDATVPIPQAGNFTAFELAGLPVFDNASVAVPVYAFAADECAARFAWYQTVATSVTDFTLIDHSNETCPVPASVPYAHLDPFFAVDTGGFTNAFIATVAEWLKARSAGR